MQTNDNVVRKFYKSVKQYHHNDQPFIMTEIVEVASKALRLKVKINLILNSCDPSR